MTTLVARFGGSLDSGLEAASVDRIVPARGSSQATDLCAVTNARYVDAAQGAAVVLVRDTLASRLPAGRRWMHPEPIRVIAELLSRVSVPARGTAEVHVTAEVASGAVVCDGAVIGADSRIGPNAVVHSGVRLGQRVVIGAGSVIGSPGFGWLRQADGTALRIPQLGGVVIEDDVELGALCSVDSGTLSPTRIGTGSKLDAQVHVGHNVQIGRRVLVAAQVGFAGSVVVGDQVQIGGQAGVADHVEIGAGASIAAKSGVISDVAPGAVFAGYPAVPRWRWLRGMARVLRTNRASD